MHLKKDPFKILCVCISTCPPGRHFPEASRTFTPFHKLVTSQVLACWCVSLDGALLLWTCWLGCPGRPCKVTRLFIGAVFTAIILPYMWPVWSLQIRGRRTFRLGTSNCVVLQTFTPKFWGFALQYISSLVISHYLSLRWFRGRRTIWKYFIPAYPRIHFWTTLGPEPYCCF